MITCRELIDFILDYDEGRLSRDERVAFEAHLAVCKACVNYLEGYRRSIELSRAALLGRADEEPPPEVPAELLSAVLAARRKKT